MSLNLRLLFFALGCCLLSGCLDTREDIQAQEERRALQNQVTSLQKNTADHGARYQEIDEQVRAINGRADALEAQLKQQNERRQSGDAQAQKEIAELQQKINLLTETVAGLQTQLGALQQQAEAARQAQEDKVKVNAENGDRDSDPLASGKREYDNKNWKKAIVIFEKYRSANPKGKYYAVATYKIGMSFKELDMKQEARAFFEEVTAKFPKSEEAKKAGRQLKKLK